MGWFQEQLRHAGNAIGIIVNGGSNEFPPESFTEFVSSRPDTALLLDRKLDTLANLQFSDFGTDGFESHHVFSIFVSCVRDYEAKVNKTV